jgi:hypothetical protein
MAAPSSLIIRVGPNSFRPAPFVGEWLGHHGAPQTRVAHPLSASVFRSTFTKHMISTYDKVIRHGWRLRGMSNLMDFPLFVFVLSFVVMWLSARIGFFLRERQARLEQGAHLDLDLIVSATLTLLALIIGFSFSMAITRYEQRKNYEEAEANAIGTEYLRADLLPPVDIAKVRVLLRNYLDQRIWFYEARDQDTLRQINAATAELQTELWSAVHASAAAQEPPPVVALVFSGMNDVLNAQGYTQAGWWNRIPAGAWCLIAVVSICANLLVGYDSHRTGSKFMRLLILPFVLCIALFAIADIDSPRQGIIRVHPQNLISLAQSLQGH